MIPEKETERLLMRCEGKGCKRIALLKMYERWCSVCKPKSIELSPQAVAMRNLKASQRIKLVVGFTVGFLTVTKVKRPTNGGETKATVKCKCGSVREKSGSNLLKAGPMAACANTCAYRKQWRREQRKGHCSNGATVE